MDGFARVVMLGNLTKDPELRYTPNGTPVAHLGLAVNTPGRSKGGGSSAAGTERSGGRDGEVSFFDIVVFGKQAENCAQYLSKGRSIVVDGRLQQRRWKSDDGQNRSKVEVVAQWVQFLGGPRDGSTGGRPGPRGTAPEEPPAPEAPEPAESGGGAGGDEEVPF